MTDTTPDYAGLLERLEESPNHALILAAYERRELITALRTLLESNAALERERDQLRDKLHCMCGSPIDHSAWEGHTPVSVYDYYLDQERSRAERAEAQLAEITEGSRQEFAANMGPMRAYWLQTDHTRLMAENGNLRALLAEKNKALEPFARNVELIPLGAQDHDRLCDYGSQFNGTPTVGQARAARRALEAQGGENG